MRSLTLRKWRGTTILAVVATAGLLGAAPHKRPVCQEAIAWAVAHKAALPTTLGSFASYSAPYRRAIYGNLRIDQKVALWREHFAQILTHHSDLTSDQRQLITTVSARLDSLIGGADTTRKYAELRLLGSQVTAVFGREVGRRLFAFDVLGQDIGAVRAVNSTAAKAKTLEFCNCNPETDWWDCLGGGSCREAGADCWPQPAYPGCGPMGVTPCTGWCEPPPSL